MTDSTLDTAYAAYKADPNPDNLSRVVGYLQPSIDFGLAQHGMSGDPLIRAKAKSYAADAVMKYDPSFGASLPTFLSHQLRQLSRATRQLRSPVHIPDRIQKESLLMHQATQRYQDEHGREPDTLELADFTGIPVKRIEHVRKYQRAIPTQEAIGETADQTPDHDLEALDYVYHDADHVDRRILDLKLGYAGHPVLPAAQVALKLKLTPTQLSRRSARLALRINRIAEILKS